MTRAIACVYLGVLLGAILSMYGREYSCTVGNWDAIAILKSAFTFVSLAFVFYLAGFEHGDNK